MICLDDMKDNNLIVPLSFFREVYVIKILDHRIYFSKAGYWKSIKVNVLHYGKKRTREHNVEDTKDLNDMTGERGVALNAFYVQKLYALLLRVFYQRTVLDNTRYSIVLRNIKPSVNHHF